jgi:tetrapyrrole methylase family protein/MazG family protein
MSTITIAGLGPGNPKLRTLETAEAIAASGTIVLRTSIHPGIEDLIADERVVACDDLYKSSEKFEDLYIAIARRVVEMASRSDVLYLTPGHPRYGEHVTPAIERLAAEAGHAVVVLDAVSAFDAMSNALGFDLMAREPQMIDATTLAMSLEQSPFSAGVVDLSPYRAIIVTQVYSREMAVAAKLSLGRLFGDEHELTVVRAAGTAGERLETIPLHRLDRVDVDHLTTLWVEPQPVIAGGRAFSGLLQIAARLRAPDGCPWDREQTQSSLIPSMLEEAYEAIEAIEGDDPQHAAEELGDLLLHIAMQSQIAEENELFAIEDVLFSITSKLIRRHPHVFGEDRAKSATDVVGIWQQVKAAEQGRSQPKPEHPLDRYPAAMPIARRLHDTIKPIASTEQPAADDLGDSLFSATRAAIEAGYDPEALLLAAAKRAIPADKPSTNDNA